MAAIADRNSPATEAEVREALQNVLSNPEFKVSARNRRFLSYVVEEALNGHPDRLSGARIAVAVFDRNSDFNSQVDPVVRVEAGRLRRELTHYYLTAGKYDQIRIDIPKGRYAPTFTRNGGDADPAVVDPPPARPRPEPEWVSAVSLNADARDRRTLAIGIAILTFAAALWAFVLWH